MLSHLDPRWDDPAMEQALWRKPCAAASAVKLCAGNGGIYLQGIACVPANSSLEPTWTYTENMCCCCRAACPPLMPQWCPAALTTC